MAKRKSTKKDEEGSLQVIPQDEANVELKVKGSGDQVRRAMGKVADPADPEEEAQDELEGFFMDPRNIVIVKRTFPATFEGKRCAFEVARYECPIGITDVREDVFARFGGKKYRVSIHPNSPTGELRPLKAIMIENPVDDLPVLPDEDDDDDDETMNLNNLDPYAIEDRDPKNVLHRTLQDRAKYLQERMQMKQLEESLADLEESTDKGRRRRGGKNDEEEDRVFRMERMLSEDRLQREMDRKVDALNKQIEELKKVREPNQDPNQNVMMMILQNQMEMNKILITQMSAPKTNVDSDLDRMAKLVEITGVNKDGNQNAMLQDVMMELLLSKLRGDDSVDDPWLLAVKELAPMVRQFADKKVNQGASREEIKKIYEEAARKAVQEFAAKAKAQQQQMALAKNVAQQEALLQQQKQGMTQPPQPVTTPLPQQVEPAPEEEGQDQEAEVPERIAPRGGAGMLPGYEDIPPGPLSKAYDRKLAIDYVLDYILDDIEEGCPTDGRVIAEILDRLDEKILSGLTGVTTAAELERLIGPWADKERMDEIKKRAEEDERVEIWLRRVVVTAADEFRAQVAHAQAAQSGAPAIPGEMEGDDDAGTEPDGAQESEAGIGQA